MRWSVYFSYRICRFLMFLMSLCLSAVLPLKEAMVYPINFRCSICFIFVLSRYYPCLFWPGWLVCHLPCPELLLTVLHISVSLWNRFSFHVILTQLLSPPLIVKARHLLEFGPKLNAQSMHYIDETQLQQVFLEWRRKPGINKTDTFTNCKGLQTSKEKLYYYVNGSHLRRYLLLFTI